MNENVSNSISLSLFRFSKYCRKMNEWTFWNMSWSLFVVYRSLINVWLDENTCNVKILIVFEHVCVFLIVFLIHFRNNWIVKIHIHVVLIKSFLWIVDVWQISLILIKSFFWIVNVWQISLILMNVDFKWIVKDFRISFIFFLMIFRLYFLIVVFEKVFFKFVIVVFKIVNENFFINKDDNIRWKNFCIWKNFRNR